MKDEVRRLQLYMKAGTSVFVTTLWSGIELADILTRTEMTTAKDESYDPPTNYNSDSDTELNNSKISPCSSPLSAQTLDAARLFNNFGSTRLGGPLTQSASNPDRRQCQNSDCNEYVPVGEMRDGKAYTCSLKVNKPDDYRDTHRFCEECAELDECPVCDAIKCDDNYHRIPNILPD